MASTGLGRSIRTTRGTLRAMRQQSRDLGADALADALVVFYFGGGGTVVGDVAGSSDGTATTTLAMSDAVGVVAGASDGTATTTLAASDAAGVVAGASDGTADTTLAMSDAYVPPAQPVVPGGRAGVIPSGFVVRQTVGHIVSRL